MAEFKINEQEQVTRFVRTDDRIWLDEDGKVVADGDPRARSLFAAPGDEIDRGEAIRLGLVKPTKEERAELKAAEKAEAAETAEAVEAASVKDVLAGVGDDKEKAQAALDAEKATDQPRKSLVKGLEKVLAAE